MSAVPRGCQTNLSVSGNTGSAGCRFSAMPEMWEVTRAVCCGQARKGSTTTAALIRQHPSPHYFGAGPQVYMISVLRYICGGEVERAKVSFNVASVAE